MMNKLQMPRAFCVLILTFICGTSFSADRYVTPPGGYGTNDTTGGYTNWLGAATNIQWAVYKAAAGETVWLTNGTYYLTNQITFTNGITVRGVNGRDVTFVNGNYPATTNRCFYITNSVTLDGLTVYNGFVVSNSPGGAYGGGVYLSANGATIQNCTITGNKAYCPTNDFYARGGGIFANNLASVLNCTVSYNIADSGKSTDLNQNGGGGVYVNDTGGGATISNCVIFTNVAGSFNVGYTNSARGGGVNLYGAGLVVNCNIYSNWASYRGGGVSAYVGGTLRNCTIYNNYAYNLGSGIGMEGPTVADCLLFGNVQSAALQSYGAYSRNCTVARNGAAGTFTWGAAYFDNVISYSNTSSDTSGGGNPPDPSYSNCCWLTGYSLTNGAGNISNNPQFVNSGANNYRLANNSPCINTGTNRSWMTNAFDLDGKPRIRFGIVDRGAYERAHEATFYRFH